MQTTDRNGHPALMVSNGGEIQPISKDNPLHIKIVGGNITGADGQSVDTDALKNEILAEAEKTATRIATEKVANVPTQNGGTNLSEEQTQNLEKIPAIEKKLKNLETNPQGGSTDAFDTFFAKGRTEPRTTVVMQADINASKWSNNTTLGYYTYQTNEAYAGKIIKKINLVVRKVGVFKIFRITNYGSPMNELNIAQQQEITADHLGFQWFDIDLGTFWPDDRFAICNKDTAQFGYGAGNDNVNIPNAFSCYNVDTGAYFQRASGDKLQIGIEVQEVNATTEEKYNRLEPFKSKRMAVIGDSISTFSGTMPSGNATFYPRFDIKRAEDTWVNLLADKLGAEVTLRDAWSASRVSNTGAGSLQGRIGRVTADTDIVIMFIGTNDLGNGVPLWTVSKTFTGYNTAEFTGAYQNYLDNLIKRVPRAKIVLCTPLRRYDKNNDVNGLVDDFSERVIELAKLYGVQYVDLRLIGANQINHSLYFTDKLHPNVYGMKVIADYIHKNIVL